MISGVVTAINIVKFNWLWQYVTVPTPAVVAAGQKGFISVEVINDGNEQWWPHIRWQVSTTSGLIIDDSDIRWTPLNPGETHNFIDWTDSLGYIYWVHWLTFNEGLNYQIEICLYPDWVNSTPLYCQMNPLTTVGPAPDNVHITFPSIPTARKL